MKWLSAKFLEGFFILLPVLIAYLMLGQLFDGLVALTVPVADLLPLGLFEDEVAHRITAAVTLVVLFIIAGIAAGTRIARRLGAWFEAAVLNRFPPYTVIKMLATRMSGNDTPQQLQPALLTVSPGARMLVAVVEQLPNGLLTVFVPVAPTPGMGHLQIVASENVERLDASMSSALGWVLNWGTGTQALLEGSSIGSKPRRG